MKGMVFTEFLELVEDAFGMDVCDTILERVDPPSGGSYTAVGTYDHQELVDLVAALSDATSTPIPDLLRTFGRHLFGRFVQGYPALFEDADDPLDFLASVEEHIHVEVRKLYPDAELPTFDHDRTDDGLELVYRSPRPFGPFAEGLIEGCIEHFGRDLAVESEDRSANGESAVRFLVR